MSFSLPSPRCMSPLIALMVIGGCYCNAMATDEVYDIPDHIKKEWKILLHKEHNITGSYKIISNAKNGNRERPGRTMKIKRCPGHVYLETELPDKSTVILVSSPKYIFSAKKGMNKEWSLTKIVPAENHEGSDELLRMVAGFTSGIALEPLSTIHLSDTGLSLMPRLKRTAKSEDIFTSFNYTEKDNQISFDLKDGFKFILNLGSKDDMYMIKGAEAYKETKPSDSYGRVVKKLSTQTWPGVGIPLCESYVYSQINEKTKENITYVRVDFSDYDFSTPPAEIFTLAHYNLPEPDFLKTNVKGGIPNYVLFVIASVFTAIVAYLVWRRSRGTQAT